jgi:hypothetical protein
MKEPNFIQIHETLDRNKILDEAVFLALCGLQHCRDGLDITGVTRLEMACSKLTAVINRINNNLEKGIINETYESN